MAGRLRLALNPEMAALFEPEPKSLIDRVQRLPVLITSAICILLPNGAAGRFNWNYNFEVLKQEAPQLVPQFLQLAKYINIVAYPFGTALLVWFSLEVARAMKHAEMNLPATEHGLSATWNLGTRAAILGGGVWMTCGLIYPLAMRLLSEDFSPDLAINFFVSLTICGGVAWTYPFFGLTYVAVMAYYPRLVSPSMSDPAFVKRSRDMRRKMLVYLASTALIPLLALTLMIMRHGAWKGYLLSTVAVTALGLFAAFYAYQRLETVIQSMGKVLDHRGSLEQN